MKNYPRRRFLTEMALGAAVPFSGAAAERRSLRIVLPRRPGRLTEKAASLIARTVTGRSGCRVVQGSPADYRLTLAVGGTSGAEGFRIERSPNAARIVAGDERGCLYGAGRFLRDCQYGETGIRPGAWRGASVPQLPVRGIYFATHFHNFYHDAPLEQVVRYVEELSLWGCNSLMVWFDMHHYGGIGEEAARQMIARLRAILRAASGAGMGVSLVFLGNEGYASTPPGLRVTPAPLQFGCEVCPSKPGGLDLIVKNRREVLERFADIDIEYFCFWPHDNGGCGCKACNPWGARGFVQTIRSVEPMLKKMFPRARTIVSTWCFNRPMQGEFEGLWKILEQEPRLADYVMADAHAEFPPFVLEHGGPAGLPLLDFPEISMTGMLPWGGFGNNPLPQHIDRMWQPSRHLMSGGFPYSEGIYEDVNKAIMLQLYWNPGRQVRDIVREYAAYEWSWEDAEALTTVAMRLGQGAEWSLRKELGIDVYYSRLAAVASDAVPRDTPFYSLPAFDASAQNRAAVNRAAARQSTWARSSWRWRTLWLRVAIEDELRRSGGRPTAQSDAFFDELTSIYCAQNADPWVSPPNSRFVAGLMANAKGKRVD